MLSSHLQIPTMSNVLVPVPVSSLFRCDSISWLGYVSQSLTSHFLSTILISSSLKKKFKYIHPSIHDGHDGHDNHDGVRSFADRLSNSSTLTRSLVLAKGFYKYRTQAGKIHKRSKTIHGTEKTEE